MTEFMNLGIDELLDPREHRTEEINRRLKLLEKRRHLRFLERFGFDNPFVLVMRRDRARQLNILDEKGKLAVDGVVPAAPPERVVRVETWDPVRFQRALHTRSPRAGNRSCAARDRGWAIGLRHGTGRGSGRPHSKTNGSGVRRRAP